MLLGLLKQTNRIQQNSNNPSQTSSWDLQRHRCRGHAAVAQSLQFEMIQGYPRAKNKGAPVTVNHWDAGTQLLRPVMPVLQFILGHVLVTPQPEPTSEQHSFGYQNWKL